MRVRLRPLGPECAGDRRSGKDPVAKRQQREQALRSRSQRNLAPRACEPELAEQGHAQPGDSRPAVGAVLTGVCQGDAYSSPQARNPRRAGIVRLLQVPKTAPSTARFPLCPRRRRAPRLGGAPGLTTAARPISDVSQTTKGELIGWVKRSFECLVNDPAGRSASRAGDGRVTPIAQPVISVQLKQPA